MSPDHYTLSCLQCNRSYQDTASGFLLSCDENHAPALLRARYAAKQLAVHADHPGIFRYSDWLPVRRIPAEATGPVVYQSAGLGHYLKLENLFVAFNGYWPEKGAFEETCSFKELEAQAVCARIPDTEKRTLVVSSAGNTGMAFLQTCSKNEVPVFVVVPEKILPELWMTVEKNPCVTLAVVSGDVDYSDVIDVGQEIAVREGFFSEGGARNVARRDGMGSVVLAAVEHLGEIPAHYFQAVGSGTGGIAAWEMGLRLREDGRFGRTRMRLHFVQNSPFTIMTDSWREASRELIPFDEREGRNHIDMLHAKVLSNRRPPYSVVGGVFDALSDTRGGMYSATREEALRAGQLFEKLEGIDIHPAAEVALAGLIQAVQTGKIRKRDIVLLNVTGGGSRRLAREGKKHALKPDVVIRRGDNIGDALKPTLINI